MGQESNLSENMVFVWLFSIQYIPYQDGKSHWSNHLKVQCYPSNRPRKLLQCGAPPDISWFINPINYSYKYYKL